MNNTDASLNGETFQPPQPFFGTNRTSMNKTGADDNKEVTVNSNGLGWNNLWGVVSSTGATAFFSYLAVMRMECWWVTLAVFSAFLSYVSLVWLLTKTKIDVADGHVHVTSTSPLWPYQKQKFELAICKYIDVRRIFPRLHGFPLRSYKLVFVSSEGSRDILWVDSKQEADQVLHALLMTILANRTLQQTA